MSVESPAIDERMFQTTTIILLNYLGTAAQPPVEKSLLSFTKEHRECKDFQEMPREDSM